MRLFRLVSISLVPSLVVACGSSSDTGGLPDGGGGSAGVSGMSPSGTTAGRGGAGGASTGGGGTGTGGTADAAHVDGSQSIDAAQDVPPLDGPRMETSTQDTGASDGARDTGMLDAPTERTDAARDTGADAGSDSSAVDSGADAVADAVDSGLVDGGACNAVVNTAADVPVMQIATAIPTPLGGVAVTSGTYYVVAANIYTGGGGASGPTGNTIRITTNVTTVANAGTIQLVRRDNAGPDMYTSYSAMFGATTVSIDDTCPTVGNAVDGYTSEVTTSTLGRPRVHIYYPGNQEIVYERQP